MQRVKGTVMSDQLPFPVAIDIPRPLQSARHSFYDPVSCSVRVTGRRGRFTPTEIICDNTAVYYINTQRNTNNDGGHQSGKKK